MVEEKYFSNVKSKTKFQLQLFLRFHKQVNDIITALLLPVKDNRSHCILKEKYFQNFKLEDITSNNIFVVNGCRSLNLCELKYLNKA